MNLTDPIFTDADKAREHLEAQRWPHGPVCPHCGVVDKATALKGSHHRAGLYQCNACREQFTATVGTVFERSKVPLNKWLLASFLMASSKKGISAHQIGRTLGVTYKTAWFMCHRIREAMNITPTGPLGGEGKVIEADETYVGGKETNKHKNKRLTKFDQFGGKLAVMTLVERDGAARSFHVANVTAKHLRPVLVKHALTFINMEDAAKTNKTWSDATLTQRKIDVPLLETQEAFFVYCADMLDSVRSDVMKAAGRTPTRTVSAPPKMSRPPMHN